MESKEQRIATLAATLKSSGIAKSDAQAKMMAEDMVNVEEHVQKNYEEKHAQAHEYLQTAKNLGASRQTIKPEPKPELKSQMKSDVKPEGSRMIEPLSTSNSSDMHKTKISEIPPVLTDLKFDGKTLNQAFDHDTHNAALEAIKAQIGAEKIAPLDANKDNVDLGLDDIDDGLDIVPAEVPVEDDMRDEVVMQEVDNIIEAPEKPKSEDAPDVQAELDVSDVKLVDEISEAVPQKLDAQKLVELMEEDGKLEEHTREIKEKPKVVKPKEAYEENNIDLGSVFNFNKK
ncbi:MAG: hypothetical protein ACP5OA_03955 [Candidatus Woesearchaeota archaeon]